MINILAVAALLTTTGTEAAMEPDPSFCAPRPVASITLNLSDLRSDAELLSGTEVPSRFRAYLLAGLPVASDYASTEYLRCRLDRPGVPGSLQELNPMPGMDTALGRAVWSAGALVAIAEGTLYLERSGYTTAAKRIRWGIVALRALVIASNLHQAR